MPPYGTRLSTVLLVRKNGQVLFIERDIWKIKDGVPFKSNPPTERKFMFKLDIAAAEGPSAETKKKVGQSEVHTADFF